MVSFRIGIAVVVVCTVFCSLSIAGSYGMQSIDSYVSWRPGCYEPSTPSFFVVDTDSYNMAVDEYNRYVSEAQDYLDCLRREANQDIEEMSSTISEGVSKAENEVMMDVDQAKRDLESAKMLLY